MLSYRRQASTADGSARRRSGALLFTILVHVLLLWLLLRIAPDLMPAPPPGSRTTTFDVAAEGEAAPAKAEKAAASRSGGSRPAAAARPAPPQPERETAETPGPLTLPEGIIVMTRRDFAGGDVSRLPREAGAGAGTKAAASGEGDGEEVAEASGGGGGGERLYDVDWYRKPSNAELSPYLRKPGLSGWGMIACRTAKDYRVEDCRELDQSPVGSGFARAVREAAWQFRVLPPRVGNQQKLGVWVRIRIEYTNGQIR